MADNTPYLWIRSGKLRNPLNPPQPHRRGRRARSAYDDEKRPESSTSSRSSRRVKTTTSTNWFQTSQLPDYIKGRHHTNGTTSGVPALRSACLTTGTTKEVRGTPHSDNWHADKANGILTNSSKEIVNGKKTVDNGRRIKPSIDPKASSSKESLSLGNDIQMNGRRRQNPIVQCHDTSADEDEMTDLEFQMLCPNINRRSSSLAGLKSIVDRVGTPADTLQPNTELRPKSTHQFRTQTFTPPQPRTSSARVLTRRPPDKRPVSSAVSQDGRATTAGSASTGIFLEHLLSEQEGDVGEEYTPRSLRPTPVSFRKPAKQSLTKPTLRPITAAHTSAKVKRLLDERFRTIYQSRRAHSAITRAPVVTPFKGGSSLGSRGGGGGGGTDRPRSRSPQPPTATSQSGQEDGMEPAKTGGKFRRIARIAMQLYSVLRASIDRSCDMTTRSATELQWMTVYAEREDTTLTFNKHLFSRERVITHVPDWAQEIFSLQPEERTDGQCRRLHALLRGLKSFDKFTEQIQMALCRAFTMVRLEERRVVLKTGHVGLNFYFLYSGSVFVNQDDTSKDGTTFVRTVAVLARGDSFGELALLRDIRRNATITVREKCELLVIDKDTFGKVCPAIFEQELEERHEFIKSLALFSGKWWSQEALNFLSMNSQIQEYKTNKVIAVDSVLEDFIFACMEGRCQVVRCLCLDRPQKDKGGRRTSEIVLSEEILQLLSSTAIDDTSSQVDTAMDKKENLLTSLGLDYVNTGKKLASMDVTLTEQKRVRLGVDGAATLTSLMKKQREVLKKELVYLNLGSIGAGEVFDLKSLVDETPVNENDPSSLMLISSGSKVLKIRKGAFHETANQQALDHTRTLASKQRNPSEDIILDSYKEKVAWDTYKDKMVRHIVTTAKRRHAPQFRENVEVPIRAKSAHREESDSSQIISALERSRSIVEQMTTFSWSDDSEEDDDSENEDNVDGSKKSNRIQSRMGETESVFQAILKEGEQNKTGEPRFADLVIMKRKPPPQGKKKIVSKEPEPVKPIYKRLLEARAS